MPRTEPIPQPKGDPLIGNLRAIDGDAPMQGFMRLARIHGPIFQLEFFGRPLILVGSQEIVDELCDESRFDKRVHATLKNIRDFAGDGLFTAKTDEPNWAKAHRLLMPAFGPIGIRGMFDQMLDIADQMLVRWERFGPNAVIDVTDDMTRLTLDTIALCAFDYRFNSFYQREMHPFVGAMVDALSEAGARERRLDIANKLMLRKRRAYEDDLKLMREVADGLIAERKRDPEGAQKKDLLGLMLQGRDPVTGEGLSDENIRYQLVTFLIAGHETTSGLLSFATYFLCKNPQVLQKARAEVDAVLGDEMPRIEHLAKLRYIEQILMETLRIWPTAPAFALRPLGDTVIAGKYAVSRARHADGADPDAAPRPEGVGRRRRGVPSGALRARAMEKLPPNAWKPFGNGQRACIGRPFAMQEAQLRDVDDPAALRPDRGRSVLPALGRRDADAEAARLPDPRQAPRLARRSSCAAQCRRWPPSRSRRRAAAPRRRPGTRRRCWCSTARTPARPRPSPSASRATPSRRATWPSRRRSTSMSAQLPADGAVVLLTASYEGQPPDNARQFVAWLEALAPGALKGVRYAVFGCGNRQWARTYQAVPKRFDAALEAAGATRIKERGETDAGGDFFGAFDEWYGALWSDLGARARQGSAGRADRRSAAGRGRQDRPHVDPAARRPRARRGRREPRAGRHGVAARTLEAPHRHRAAGGHDATAPATTSRCCRTTRSAW